MSAAASASHIESTSASAASSAVFSDAVTTTSPNGWTSPGAYPGALLAANDRVSAPRGARAASAADRREARFASVVAGDVTGARAVVVAALAMIGEVADAEKDAKESTRAVLLSALRAQRMCGGDCARETRRGEGAVVSEISG